jgi:hypothetical protein
MSDDEAQRKAAKKAAKRARREAEEAVANAEPEIAEAIEETTEEDEEARRARKAAKKAAKKAKRDAEDAAAAAAAVEAEQPSKKKHKSQSARSDGVPMGNYIPHAAMSSMTMQEADAFRANAGITLTPPEAAEKYHPITQFEHLRPSLGELCPDVMHYVEAKKFKTPTFIQVYLLYLTIMYAHYNHYYTSSNFLL